MMLLLKDEKGIITMPSAFEVATYIVEELGAFDMIENDHWVTAMAISDLATDIMKAYEMKSVEPLQDWRDMCKDLSELMSDADELLEEVIEDVRGTANN